MNRRSFLSVPLAVVASVAIVPSKPIVRFTTDCDLTRESLRWAITLAGFVEPPDVYRLRVHPEQASYAEHILREEFGDQWRASLVIDRTLPDIDEWYLEGSKAIAYSAGA